MTFLPYFRSAGVIDDLDEDDLACIAPVQVQGRAAFVAPAQVQAPASAVPAQAVQAVQAAAANSPAATSIEHLIDALELAMVTPPPSPDVRSMRQETEHQETAKESQPARRAEESPRPPFVEPQPRQAGPKAKSPKKAPCRVPTASDPRDETFALRLFSSPADARLINPVHHMICAEILEGRRTRSGKVYFQCLHCEHAPLKRRARRSTVAPRSIGALYRAVNLFAMDHLRHCLYIPDEMKQTSPKDAKGGKFKSGVKDRWVEEARALGLEDAEGKIVCRAGVSRL